MSTKTPKRQLSKPQYLGRSLGLVLLAFLGMLLGSIISVFLPFQTEYLSLASRIIISQGIGLFGVSIAYVQYTNKSFNFFQFEFEPLRDIGLIAGLAIGLVGISMVVSIIATTLEIETAKNSVTPLLQSSMANVYVFIILSILIVGPLEELFFRGTVQRYLRDGFSSKYAVIITALLFAGMHVTSMFGNVGIMGYGMYLVMLFAGGAILGYSYEYTDNLFVPMAGHGFYNAILGLSMLL